MTRITEEDSDSDDILYQSEHYANSAVSELLKKLIKEFDSYGVNSEQLVAICNMFRVTSDHKKYLVNGYISLDIKEIEGPDNFKFQEILVDGDGLRLTTGGYVTGDESGGDSYSHMVFPIDDGEAIDAVSIIDSFISEFIAKLKSDNKQIDAFDSGDGIEEK